MSTIRTMLKQFGPLRRAVLRRRQAGGVFGQSDEAQILRRLADASDAPRTFIEFGFHPAEFNCAALVTDHAGLLIDGDAHQVADARRSLPASIQVEQRFLTLDNLDLVRDAFPRLGVLSIDVDGNDYWFLDALIALAPAIIAVEYNASFIGHSVTVPYDPVFDRHAKHSSGWYHGASLAALRTLAARHGYGLAAIADGGGNAFFTRDGTLDPTTAWRSTTLRDKSSGRTATEQWATIEGLPFVQV